MSVPSPEFDEDDVSNDLWDTDCSEATAALAERGRLPIQWENVARESLEEARLRGLAAGTLLIAM